MASVSRAEEVHKPLANRDLLLMMILVGVILSEQACWGWKFGNDAGMQKREKEGERRTRDETTKYDNISENRNDGRSSA